MEDWKEVSLEAQLLKFPRGAHDDIIDALQMIYELYALCPHTPKIGEIKIEYVRGQPKISSYNSFTYNTL